MKELLQKYLGLRLTAGIVYALIGVITVVFGVLSQAKINIGVDPSLPLRIVIGVLILLTGLVALIVFLALEKTEWNLPALLGSAALAGLGFAMFFEKIGGYIIGILVAYIIPIIFAFFGAFLIVKCVTQLVRKSKALPCVLFAILGAGLLAVGILFACNPADTMNITWILLGLLVAFAGGAEVVISAKLIKASKRIAQ